MSGTTVQFKAHPAASGLPIGAYWDIDAGLSARLCLSVPLKGDAMYLTRLVYASRVSPGVTGPTVKEILAVSRRNNAQDGITGSLVFNSKYFLQCLEGPRDAVNRAYLRILKDERHHDPQILDCGELLSRNFGAWSMGYIGEGPLSRETILKYLPTDRFDPYLLTAAGAQAMLLELGQAAFALQGNT